MEREAIAAIEGVQLEGAAVAHLLDYRGDGQLFVGFEEGLRVGHRPFHDTRAVAAAPHSEVIVARSHLQLQQILVQSLVSLVIALGADRYHAV